MHEDVLVRTYNRISPGAVDMQSVHMFFPIKLILLHIKC